MTERVTVTREWLHAEDVPRSSQKRGEVILLLTPGLAERRTIRSVPRVRSATLRRIVAANVERFFPVLGPEVATTAEWVVDTDGERKARAYAVEGQVIAALLSVAARRGLLPIDIRPEGGGRGTSLLPEALRLRHRKTLMRHVVGAMTALMLMTSGTLEVMRRGVDRDRLGLALEETEQIVQARTNLATLEGLRKRGRVASEDRAATGLMIRRLVRLNGALVGGGVLTALHLKAGSITSVAMLTPRPSDAADSVAAVQSRPQLYHEAGPTLEAGEQGLVTRMALAARER